VLAPRHHVPDAKLTSTFQPQGEWQGIKEHFCSP
jgi:hypothetical protein